MFLFYCLDDANSFFLDGHIIDMKIIIGMWQHICFIIDDKKRSYFDGNVIKELSITEPKLEFSEAKLSIGTQSFMDESYSGLVADVRIFTRVITIDEMKKVAKLEEIQDAIVLGKIVNDCPQAGLTAYPFPFKVRNEDLYDYTPIFFKIKACQLLKQKPHILHFSKKMEQCKNAKKICRAFGGSIPLTGTIGSELEISDFGKLKSSWISGNSNPEQGSNDCKKVIPKNDTNEFVFKPNLGRNEFLCVIPKDTTFKFKVSKDISYDFNLLTTENMTFVSITHDMKLSIHGKEILVQSRHITLYESGIIRNDISSLMSRKKWHDYAIGADKVVIFSTCESDEFTCSDGTCTELEVICNYEKDCADGSDEEFCEAANKQEGYYDIRLSPAISKFDLAPLKMQLFLDRVIDIDMEANTMSLTIRMILMWVDPRLIFKNLMPNGQPTFVDDRVVKMFWLPKITLNTASMDSKYKFHLDKWPGRVDAVSFESAFGKREIKDGYEGKLSNEKI